MKLKFGIVGPSGAGKTLIANILGNEMSMESSVGRPPYRPTNSVRIVEFSVPNVDLRKYSSEVDVQIWEVGGNPRLKSIWPGLQMNLSGIILVYDTNNELHVRDMSTLHMHFVTHSDLNPAQCLIIGNIFRGNRDNQAKIVGVGPRVRHCIVNVDDDSNYLREEFKHFLTGVAQFTTDQEQNPMGSGFMAPERCVQGGGGGDAPVMGINSQNFLRSKPTAHNNQYEYDQQMSGYYQPYVDFHNARNNNKTRSRKKERESYIDDYDDAGGHHNNFDFNIHRKHRNQ